MARFPKMPLFTDALLGDTQHLTTEEFGGYVLMLIVAWRDKDCSLPSDNSRLQRITRSGKRWGILKRALLPFWELGEDGRLRQKRLSDEHQKLEIWSQKNANSSRARWLKTNGTGDASGYANRLVAIASPKESESRPPPVLLSSAREAPASPPAPPALPPEGGGPSRFSGEGLHPDYGPGIEVLERRLGLPAMLAWKPLNDWLVEGAPLEVVLGAITRVTAQQRKKDPAWQPRTLAYYADAVTRAKLAEAAGPPARANGWTGPNYGTHTREAARHGLKVLSAYSSGPAWMEAHGFRNKPIRHPDVQAVARTENVYLQTEED